MGSKGSFWSHQYRIAVVAVSAAAALATGVAAASEVGPWPTSPHDGSVVSRSPEFSVSADAHVDGVNIHVFDGFGCATPIDGSPTAATIEPIKPEDSVLSAAATLPDLLKANAHYSWSATVVVGGEEGEKTFCKDFTTNDSTDHWTSSDGSDGDDKWTGDDEGDEFEGGDGDDVLVGGAGSDDLDGGGGDDAVTGKGSNDDLSGDQGNDVITGGGGADQIAGGRGRDTLRGGRGADTLRGGQGADRVFGGQGADRVIAGPGADRIRVRGGGRDVVRCGRGIDRVWADASDRVSADCEIVNGRRR